MLTLRPLFANTAKDSSGTGSDAVEEGNTTKVHCDPEYCNEADPDKDKLSEYLPSNTPDIMKEENSKVGSELASKTAYVGRMTALDTFWPDKYNTGVIVIEVLSSGKAVK